MKPYQKALQGFETKAQKILEKYTSVPAHNDSKYGYLRLAGFFGHFNTMLIQVDEELEQETFGIIKKYKDNDNVDFTRLLDGLYEYRNRAKSDFIKVQQPQF